MLGVQSAHLRSDVTRDMIQIIRARNIAAQDNAPVMNICVRTGDNFGAGSHSAPGLKNERPLMKAVVCTGKECVATCRTADGAACLQ